jgi:hypothetical protein
MVGEIQLRNNQLIDKKVATTPLGVMATFACPSPALPIRFPVQARCD